MKIISKFKDYYDILVYQYGVDEKILFNRNQKITPEIDLTINDERVVQFNFIRYRHLVDELVQKMAKENKNLAWLVVCGKLLLVEEHKISNTRFSYHLPSKETFKLLSKYSGWIYREHDITQFIEMRYAKKINQEAGSPIVVIQNIETQEDSKYRFHMSESIPNLSEIKGFCKLYPKEQLYQDVVYWIANILNPSPDVQPSGKPPQNNLEKIQSHGFDPKASFRHRN